MITLFPDLILDEGQLHFRFLQGLLLIFFGRNIIHYHIVGDHMHFPGRIQLQAVFCQQAFGLFLAEAGQAAAGKDSIDIRRNNRKTDLFHKILHHQRKVTKINRTDKTDRFAFVRIKRGEGGLFHQISYIEDFLIRSRQ